MRQLHSSALLIPTGFTPKVLRLAPGGGVLLLVVEFTLETVRGVRRSDLRLS